MQTSLQIVDLQASVTKPILTESDCTQVKQAQICSVNTNLAIS